MPNNVCRLDFNKIAAKIYRRIVSIMHNIIHLPGQKKARIKSVMNSHNAQQLCDEKSGIHNSRQKRIHNQNQCSSFACAHWIHFSIGFRITAPYQLPIIFLTNVSFSMTQTEYVSVFHIIVIYDLFTSFLIVIWRVTTVAVYRAMGNQCVKCVWMFRLKVVHNWN